MADPRFFKNAGPFTLEELAAFSGARLHAKKDAGKAIVDVAPLNEAGADHISFLDNPKYLAAFGRSNAGACILQNKYIPRAPQGMAMLISDNPYRAYALIATHFYPTSAPDETFVHPTVAMHDTARISENCHIGAYSVIGRNVDIGARCRIHAGVHIGDGVSVGNDCTLHSGVNISHAVIGNRVTLHHGACIGQEGFGFATEKGRHITVPQLGRVLIGDDVEIGANTCIDRGAGPDTIIGDGTRIDNLVQIGHNVRIGKGCVIVAQVGISGSTQIGDYVMLGGQAGLAGHLTVADGARIAAQAGVMKDISPGVTVVGSPAVPARQHHRQVIALQKLAGKGEPHD